MSSYPKRQCGHAVDHQEIAGTCSAFSDAHALAGGLSSLLGGCGNVGGQLHLVARQPLLGGTFPKEIVTWNLDGSEMCLLHKYSVANGHGIRGHWGGVSYEAAVYDSVLRTSPVSLPRFYGTYADSETGAACLVLEFLDGALQAHEACEMGGMTLAARWLGQFHADGARRLQEKPLPLLRDYDVEYYRCWARRTAQSASSLADPPQWLPDLCDRFELAVERLLAAPPTLIHGEYYPKNILFRDGTIYPVDWESAAVAAGEIDLASLTEGWPADTVRECEAEYRQARWPEGAPPEFPSRLEAARLYWCLRWLGAGPKAEASFGYRKQLQEAGRYLGLA